MALKIVTPATKLPVTLEEAMDQARVEEEAAGAALLRMISAVTDWLAGRNGWLGRSLMKQTLALTVPLPILDGFTGPRIVPDASADWQRQGMCGIALPRPPVIAVSKVEMIDGAGGPTVIPADSYSTFDADDGLTHLTFQPDFRWPVIARGPAFLRVTYDAGYGEDPGDLDWGLRQAILMTVARLYEDRGAVLNQVFRDDPMIQGLFSTYRVYT